MRVVIRSNWSQGRSSSGTLESSAVASAFVSRGEALLGAALLGLSTIMLFVALSSDKPVVATVGHDAALVTAHER